MQRAVLPPRGSAQVSKTNAPTFTLSKSCRWSPMKARTLLRVSAVGLCAILLLVVNRPATHSLSHPYPAPQFSLPDLNGNPVSLSSLRGKAVVLNFWATWCGPCRREMPWFIEFQKEYGPRGLQIIGVSMDDGGRSVVLPVVQKMGVNYMVLMGDSRVGSLYGGLEVLPTTYYIAPDGNVRAFVTGVVSKNEVERNIKDLLEASARN